MAALIAGHGHGPAGSDGILGVAPAANILPCRTQSSTFDLAPSRLANGVRWAANHGASVISISLGIGIDDDAVAQAVRYAESKDIVIVAAIGNTSDFRSAAFPAAYPGVIAAAGTDEHGNHAAISVTGPEVVLAAPATNIYSDGINHTYITGSGTSNSTAIIAGAAALVRSRFPKLSAVEVIHRLTATAIDKGPKGRDDEYGYGELNIVAALTANVPLLTDSSSSATPTPTVAPTSQAPPTQGNPSHAAAPIANEGRWLPITGAVLVVLALLAVWAYIKRRSSSH